MNRRLSITGNLTLALGIVSALFLIYIIGAFEYFRPRTLMFEPMGSQAETLVLFIYAGLLVSFAFHIAALLATVFQMQVFGGEGILRRVVLVVGILSFMSLFGEVGTLDDIWGESEMGWDVSSEWIAVYFAIFTQAVFHVLVFVTVTSGIRAMRSDFHPIERTRDETVFYTVHYTGLLCGAIGLCLTFMKFMINTSMLNLKYLVIYYNGFILLPYCLIFFYWMVMKRKERPAEWYDEKQFRDLSTAGLLTLLVSLPVVAAMYTANFISPDTPLSVLWFPFYVHFVLVFFSGATLYLRER